ncbi:MAG TPA: glycosyltransferase [Anaerovoracaceae bacterium]|nr:glycosyltransferase [Anaerovoracaceae bacterium]
MIHVISLTWNGCDKLKRLEPGLMRNLANTGQTSAWYIRNNGSKDGTVEYVNSLGPKVHLLAKDHNRDNFAQGMNSLTSLARFSPEFNLETDSFLLLNDDVEFSDDVSIGKMVAQMKDDVGIVGCRLLYNGTDKLQHAGVIFSPRYGNMPYHYRHQENSDVVAEKNRYFQAVTAAVCLVRAKDFVAIGGMDEKFHWAFEDIDMNLRIGKLGRKIVYCGETKIFHEESASLKKNPVNKLFMGPNVEHFKSKWLGKYELDHDKYLKDPTYNEVKS